MPTDNPGRALGSISLVIALIAFVPSVGFFTPAIFLSVVAGLGAVISTMQGAFRTGILTMVVITCTFIVSPLSPSTQWFSSLRPENWMMGMALLWLVLAGALLGSYFLRNRT